MTHNLGRLLSLAVLAATCASSAHAQCEAWEAVGPGTTRVAALASFDDGTGPALYAGGPVGIAGGVSRWDGSTWTSVGGLTGGTAGAWVSDLAVFDDGTGPALYLAGIFTAVDGVPANSVAKWDGAAWSPLGAGLTGSTYSAVSALTVHDDGSGLALYASGGFSSAGGVPANGVARWNGTTWSAVGPPVPAIGGPALAVFDDGSGPALFTATAGLQLWKWDGAAWTLQSTVTGVLFPAGVAGIAALESFDDGTGEALYASGAFSVAGIPTARNVARWNGATWSEVGGGIGGSGVAGINPPNVVALHAFGTRLYAGGWFTEAGGAPASGIAAWDGSAWSDLDGGIGAGLINGVFGFGTHDDGSGPALYAGGQFLEIGGTPALDIAARKSFPAASVHCAAETYCTASPNSTGAPAAISACGTASVAANDLSLRAEPVPDQPGLFFYGPLQTSLPFGNGTLCVVGQIGRLDVVNATGNVMTFAVDYTNPPSAGTQIAPGSTWNFQAWFRDPAAGGGFFDLSNGLSVAFYP